MEESNNI
jgi:signal transduction histidine kinase